MKPFRKDQQVSLENKMFNARLSHARQIIECAFGVLSKKWSIFKNHVNFKLRNTEIVILACVCLHNYLITQELDIPEHERRYYTNNEDFFDYNKEEIESDDEPDDEESSDENELDEELADDADEVLVHDRLKNYFVSAEGYTTWQWKKLGR